MTYRSAVLVKRRGAARQPQLPSCCSPTAAKSFPCTTYSLFPKSAHLTHSAHLSHPLFSITCRLFCPPQIAKFHPFISLPPLARKHGGWGVSNLPRARPSIPLHDLREAIEGGEFLPDRLVLPGRTELRLVVALVAVVAHAWETKDMRYSTIDGAEPGGVAVWRS